MEHMLRNVKGTKDYMPQEQGLRNRIRQTFEEVFAAYGCKPLETPTCGCRSNATRSERSFGTAR